MTASEDHEADKAALVPVKSRKKRLSELAKRRKISAWRKAYVESDDKQIKKDAGELMGRVYVRAREMLEIIEREGMILEAPQVDRSGNAVVVIGADGVRDYIWEKKTHPLLDALIKVLRVLKIDLHEFMLTPLAQGVGSPSLEGGIAATQINIEELHVHQTEQIAQFRKALEMSEKLRAADPVYQDHLRQLEGGKV